MPLLVEIVLAVVSLLFRAILDCEDEEEVVLRLMPDKLVAIEDEADEEPVEFGDETLVQVDTAGVETFLRLLVKFSFTFGGTVLHRSIMFECLDVEIGDDVDDNNETSGGSSMRGCEVGGNAPKPLPPE